MSRTVEDLLASDYVHQSIAKQIDHGVEKPRSGDFSMMKQLQRDLLEEQDRIHGGNRKDMGQKWATLHPIPRLYRTTDLYEEMVDSDGEVAAVADEIISTEEDLVDSEGQHWIVHTYSTTVTYTINAYAMLVSIGVPLDEREYQLHLMENDVESMTGYIAEHGPELFDRFLPAEQGSKDYFLDWSVQTVDWRPPHHLEVSVRITEGYTGLADA